MEIRGRGAELDRLRDHYWRTQLTDHLHCLEIVSSLSLLHE